ncbi:unnamed protein product, partial [Bemisia tabaci]
MSDLDQRPCNEHRSWVVDYEYACRLNSCVYIYIRLIVVFPIFAWLYFSHFKKFPSETFCDVKKRNRTTI